MSRPGSEEHHRRQRKLLKVSESNTFIDIQRFVNRDQNDKEKLDCRLKLINTKNAISINALPFMKEEFISGARKKIYLALKILKEATEAKITSYQLKTLLLKVFRRQPDNMKIGEAVLKVFKQGTNLKKIKDEKIHMEIYSTVSTAI